MSSRRGSLWRCRACFAHNPQGQGCCGQCGSAYIPNLRQILSQERAQPYFTPLWGKGKGWDGNGGKGMGKGASFGKGNGKGDGKGWYHGKGHGPSPHNSFQFPPPVGGGGKGGVPPTPPPTTGWRKAHQASARAAKDAAAAARLAAGADGMDVTDSEVGSQNASDLFGASRHNRRLASEVQGVCPEAASKLEAAADLLFQRGQDAMPLAQQVASLEKKVGAKIKETETIRGQMVSLHLRLEQVGMEGAVLEKQLDEAKAKLVAAPAAPSPPPAAPPMDLQAIMNFMRTFSTMLPQDMGGGFASCLDHIETVAAAQGPPLAPPTLPPPGKAGDGVVDPSAGPALTSPTPLGSAGGADSALALEAPTILAASVVDVEAEAAAASAAVAAAHASGSAASGPGRGSKVGTSSRARSRTHSPAANANAYIRDGKRYFSDFAERAGLDDDNL